MRRLGVRGAAVALVLCVAAVTGCAPGGGGTGDAMPDVMVDTLIRSSEGTATVGEPVKLSDIDGPAVINVWSTTCAPCVREMPALQAVASDRSDVAFYGLNIAQDPTTVADFVDELDVDYAQLLDLTATTTNALGIVSMPTTFVLDGDGAIASTHRGEITAEALRKLLPNP